MYAFIWEGRESVAFHQFRFPTSIVVMIVIIIIIIIAQQAENFQCHIEMGTHAGILSADKLNECRCDSREHYRAARIKQLLVGREEISGIDNGKYKE